MPTDPLTLPTLSQLAATLHVPPTTIRGWLHRHRIPQDCYLKVGLNRYRFYPEKVRAWLDREHRGNLSGAPCTPPVDGSGPRHEGPVAGQGA